MIPCPILLGQGLDYGHSQRLDYDHKQRLFLKNLKYETRELTFWEEGGRLIRLATSQHHDLKNCCQNLGLVCSFNATDLLLVFFCN